MKPLPFTRVRIQDGFWTPRQEINCTATLREEYRHLVETHRIDSLRMTWHPGLAWTPHEFWDSDVAKWVEAAAYALAQADDSELRGWMDETVALIIAAQRPDGYINTFITQVCPDQKWKNLRDRHELYTIGHLIEAAVAHFQTTGRREFLGCVMRCADHCDRTFGTGAGQIPGYCGHQEIELALFRLAEVTGEDRFAKLATYFLEQRGQQPKFFPMEAKHREMDDAGLARMHDEEGYSQAHAPIRQQTRVLGHAVRALYMYTAMADLAARSPEDAGLRHALQSLWSHLMERNAYITGGIGSSRHNEGFTRDYHLPNDTAYCETCASAALIFWAQRLLHMKLDRRYSDAIETALFNAFLHGVSVDGRSFFYENRLATEGDFQRSGWFFCSCCPPNLARVIASLGSYLFSASEDELVVHQFASSVVDLPAGGRVEVQTDYPWSGRIQLRVLEELPLKGIALRIPGWAKCYEIEINGTATTVETEDGYVHIARHWRAGDRLVLDLPLEVEQVFSHPMVEDDVNRVAIRRGPVVYAFEQCDHAAPVSLLRISSDTRWDVRVETPVGPSPVAVLTGQGFAAEVSEHMPLYSTTSPRHVSERLNAIPYFLTGNRSPDALRVWIPRVLPAGDPRTGG